MTVDRNALLADILQQPAESGTWSELTTLINSWPESDGLEGALDRAQAALEAWPDELRTGDRWWDAASQGREPRWRLARSLSFRRRGRALAELSAMSANEAFGRITCLSIEVSKGPELVEELVGAVGKGKELTHIRSVSLAGREIGQRGAMALATLALPALESLDLSGNGLGKPALVSLLSAPWAGQLRTLRLADNPGNLGAMQALASADLAALQSLDLKGAQNVTCEAVAALAAADFPELLEIRLEDCRFGPDGLAALAAASHWTKLRSLNLSGLDEAFGNDGAKALARSWAFPAVSVLNIGGCKIGDSGAKALASCAGLSSVQTLDISRSVFNSRGMTALAHSEAFSGVRSIQMNWCKTKAIHAMAGTPLAQSIVELRMPRTACGDDGLLALLQDDGLAQVRLLDLTRNKVTDSGIEALVGAADKLQNLGTLIAEENAITGKGLGLLSNGGLHLHRLSLAKNKLGVDVGKTVAASPLRATLRELNLRRTGLDNSGFAQLCAAEFTELRRLEVDAESVTVEGLKTMVDRVANFPRLRAFDFKKGLFDAIPKDQQTVLRSCFPLGRAVVNAGAYYLGLEEFKSVIEKTQKPKRAPGLETLPTELFELPEAETEVGLDNCGRLQVLGHIGLGPVLGVRWLSNERVLLATANGLFHYSPDNAEVAVEASSQFAHTGSGISEDGRFIAAQMPWWKGGLLDVGSGELTTWDITEKKAFSAVAFSPDNAVVAIFSDHPTESGKSLLRLRQRESGAQAQFTLHIQNRKPSMCWSPDGQYIAIGSGSSHVVVHASGEVKAKWLLGTVSAVRFSRDSTQLITATRASNMEQSGDRYLRVWDLEGNLRHAVATPHDGMYSDLNAIATHPDGQRVAVGGRDQHVHLFESREWARKHLLAASDLNPYAKGGGGWAEFEVSHLAFSSDGSKLLVCTRGQFASVQVWDTGSWTRVGIHTDFVGEFNEFTLADGGKTIAVATKSQARSYRSGEASPVVHTGWKAPYVSADVDHFRPLADGKRAVLTAGTNHDGFTFGLLDLATMELDIPFNGKTAPQALAVRAADDVIATGDENGRLVLWKPGRKTPLAKPTRHHAEVNALEWSADGSTLVSCCKDGKLRVWDAVSQSERFCYQASGARPTFGECAVSHDGLWIAAAVTNRPRGGPYTGKILIWGPGIGAPLEFVSDDKKSANALAFSPAAELIAAGTSRGRIRLIRRSDAHPVAEYQAHSGPVVQVQFDPTGCLLYSMTRNGQIKIWGVAEDESEYLIAAAPTAAATQPAAAIPDAPVVTPAPVAAVPAKVVNRAAVEAGGAWIVKHENVYILRHADVGWIEMRTHNGKAIRGSWSDEKAAASVAGWSEAYSEPIPEQNKREIDDLVVTYSGHYDALRTGRTRISILLDLPTEKKALALLGGTPMRLLFKNGGWAVIDVSGDPTADVSNAMWAKTASPTYGKFHELAPGLVDSIISAVRSRGEEQTVVFDPPLVPPPEEPNWQATFSDVKTAIANRDADELRRIFSEGNTTPRDGELDWDLLHAAARGAFLEGVEMALGADCAPNSKTISEETPLLQALMACRDIRDGTLAVEAAEGLAIVELLLQSGADASYIDPGSGRSIAASACLWGCTEEAVRLFERNEALLNVGDNGACLPIHQAAIGGHVDLLKWLVDRGSDPNIPTANAWGSRPLHFAAQYGRVEALKWLLAHGSQVDAPSANTLQPIHTAADGGQVDVMKCLIDHGADPNAATEDDWGTQPIHYAAMRGRLDAVKCLLGHGVVPSALNTFGIQSIHMAAEHGHVEVMSCLVANGANPMAPAADDWGTRPIHFAATNGRLDAVNWLLDHGADVSVLNTFGVQPIHNAAQGGSVEVLASLVARGADPTVLTGDDWGVRPVHYAAENGHLEAVKWLVGHGANARALNKSQAQPIHSAAQGGRIDVLQWLIEGGVEIGTPTGDDWGSHAIHFAAVGGQLDAIKWLVEHGAHVNSADKYGFTPLHEAAAGNQVDAAKLLVELGADKAIECTGDTGTFKPGTTPGGVAEQSGFAELASFLS